MRESIAEWKRIEFGGIPIYIRPDAPDWFVPNRAADEALTRGLEQGGSLNAEGSIQSLLKRIDDSPVAEYQSRSDHLTLSALKECWLHITNRCNMECTHCMFQSSPLSRDELSPADRDAVLRQAYELGCRLYFFTGGEPFLAEGFIETIEKVLRPADTHAVILTNLSLLSAFRDKLHSFPHDRLHFQVSVDGIGSAHDALRGAGAFDRLLTDLGVLQTLGFPATLAVTVTQRNVDQMEEIIDFASQQRISNLHFLWLFKKGHADDNLFVEPDLIFPHLAAAQERAEKVGVKIDNIEIFRSQAFSCPGTRYDLSNAGWQSIAVGPEGNVYPTPALVYTEPMRCGHIKEGLRRIWEESPILNAVRRASLLESDVYRDNPFRYLIGGGDSDHSYVHSGRIVGGDPYTELYNSIVKWLIAREARDYDVAGHPAFRLKMGEKLGECPVEGGTVFLTHSNCVLSLPGEDIHTLVNQFYTKAAEGLAEDILNPVCYEEHLISHIPEEMRYRSYGCGSPVLEADVQPDETVVDLGSGTGMECFIAGRQTGPGGKVIGIDMGDAMLALAEKTKVSVAGALQYDNVAFKKAFLEDLPLEGQSVDLVISNCVLNLSPDKRRVFKEIFRVLKPGGRLLISDITYDADIPLDIKYNETLRGECIGGALRYQDLFGLLNDFGFSESKILKGYLYRTVQGYEFYSITYRAVKPAEGRQPVPYDFPDFRETMAAVSSEPTCGRFVAINPVEKPKSTNYVEDTHKAGCMVCGSELTYLDTDRDHTCHYCRRVKAANALCAKGHFVCDECHRSDAIEIIKQVCLNSREGDAVTLMQTIRSHPRFHIHGPEHHPMVPAVILAALRNAGVSITDGQITTAIQRGQSFSGGACAFLGCCGAAIGVGIVVSLLIGGNPYDGGKRQTVQRATSTALGDIASFKAARCCQRDSWLAIQAASRVLKEMGVSLSADKTISCDQYPQNKECIGQECPLWPSR